MQEEGLLPQALAWLTHASVPLNISAANRGRQGVTGIHGEQHGSSKSFGLTLGSLEQLPWVL